MADDGKRYAYNNQYNRENYARIALMVPKEWKPEIEERAAASGLSVNAWIKRAIAAKMQEETTGKNLDGSPED